MKIEFLGNMYGLHDGYDGSVFDPEGLSPSIRAGQTHIPHIIEIAECDTEIKDGNRTQIGGTNG